MASEQAKSDHPLVALFEVEAAKEKRKQIMSELARNDLADKLLAAALTAYGALKAVEFMLPAIVRAQMLPLEAAIVEYSKTGDVEPLSEVAP